MIMKINYRPTIILELRGSSGANVAWSRMIIPRPRTGFIESLLTEDIHWPNEGITPPPQKKKKCLTISYATGINIIMI